MADNYNLNTIKDSESRKRFFEAVEYAKIKILYPSNSTPGSDLIAIQELRNNRRNVSRLFWPK